MAKRIYNIDSGYSSTSPVSYTSSMSPSQSSQDTPYQDLQSLQLSQVIDCNLNNESIDIKYVNPKEQNPFVQNNFSSTLIYPQKEEVKLMIVEQPVSKFRYRYISEMHGTHGSLMGQNSSKSNKTYPTVELKGFNGDALIRCSLYQVDKKAPHSHRLVVRKNDRDIPDPHELTLNSRDGYSAIFQHMGIIHTAKRDIANELFQKKKLNAEFEKGSDLSVREITKLKSDSEKESKEMKLNQVVLRFEAYEIINNQLRQLCEPIYSNPISNMKCALTGELKITRLSTAVSSAAGGDEVFLFVEKVNKKSIKVRFFEMENNDITWMDYGQFSEADVHHQYAIALRTPPYKNKDIDKYVNVYIQLVRTSDDDVSEPREFKYKPRDSVSLRKRARKCSSSIGSYELPTTISDAGSGTTISEEFNKNAVLDDLLNNPANKQKQDFIEKVKMDSNELIKLMDPSIFDEFDSNMENLAFDCHGMDLRTTINQRKNDPMITKNMIYKISNTLRTAKLNGYDIQKVKEDIKALLLECYERDEDLLHRIIRNQEIKEGIYLIKVLDKLNLFCVLNYTNEEDNNCLHVACYFNRYMFIRALLNLGADPNKQNSSGKTPLHVAVEEEFEECVIKIIDVESYTDRSKPLLIDLANDDGYTALHIAVKRRKLNIVKMLIERGNASTKICCSKNGNNVLHIAVEEKCPDIVNYLLNNTKVKVSEKNTSGSTPLSLAQSMGKNGQILVDMILQKDNIISNSSLKNIKSDCSSGESDDDRSIKSLKIVEDSKCNINCNTIDYFDESLIDLLSNLLTKDEKWVKLSKLLNLQLYVCLWKTPKAMFNFINESRDIRVDDVIDALFTMKEHEAIKYIKNYS